MAAASDELESRLGHYLLMSGTPAKPEELWVALYREYSLPADDGSTGTEVSRTSFGLSTGYERVLHGPGDAYWAESSTVPGQFYNVSTITFPEPLRDWGVLTGFALHPTDEGAGVWVKGSLASILEVISGDPAPAFEAGSLVINFL